MKHKSLLYLLLSFLIVSCEPSYQIHEGEFYFTDKYYNQETTLIYDEDYSKIQLALDNKESFGVYVFLTGCTSCASFKPIMEEFLDEYNIQLYSVNYMIMESMENLYHTTIKYAPAVMLFKDGELVDYLDASSDDDYYAFKSKDGFGDWFSSYVILNQKNF